MSERKYLSVVEAAEVINMSPAFVRRRCKAGDIPAKKLGRDWRITRDALDRWMQPEQERELPEAPRRRAS